MVWCSSIAKSIINICVHLSTYSMAIIHHHKKCIEPLIIYICVWVASASVRVCKYKKYVKIKATVWLTLAGQAGYPLTLANTKSPTLNESFLPIFRLFPFGCCRCFVVVVGVNPFYSSFFFIHTGARAQTHYGSVSLLPVLFGSVFCITEKKQTKIQQRTWFLTKKKSCPQLHMKWSTTTLSLMACASLFNNNRKRKRRLH